jgi:hypothetical protein
MMDVPSVYRDDWLVYVSSLPPVLKDTSGGLSRGEEGPPLTLGDVRRFVAEADAAAVPDSRSVHAVIFGSDSCGNLRELRAFP